LRWIWSEEEEDIDGSDEEDDGLGESDLSSSVMSAGPNGL